VGCQSEEAPWSQLAYRLVDKARAQVDSGSPDIRLEDLKDDEGNVLCLYQHVVLGLANFPPPAACIQGALARLLEEMEPLVKEVGRRRVRKGTTRGMNPAERRLSGAVTKVISSMDTTHEYEVLSNVLLHGFEADIVVQRKVSQSPSVSCITSTLSSPPLCINVESDGEVHELYRKKRFCSLRDKYLEREKGVVVLRLTVAEMRRLSDEGLVAKLNNLLDPIFASKITSNHQ